jgi:hypothetical protein
VANSGQRCRWLCVGGADGGRSAAVLYGALDMELANMNPIDNDDDDDTQVYKRPWIGLTGQEKALIASVSLDVHDAVHRTEAKLREKNA